MIRNKGTALVFLLFSWFSGMTLTVNVFVLGILFLLVDIFCLLIISSKHDKVEPVFTTQGASGGDGSNMGS